MLSAPLRRCPCGAHLSEYSMNSPSASAENSRSPACSWSATPSTMASSIAIVSRFSRVLLLVSQWITWTVSGRKRPRTKPFESAARRSIAGKRWRYWREKSTSDASWPRSGEVALAPMHSRTTASSSSHAAAFSRSCIDVVASSTTRGRMASRYTLMSASWLESSGTSRPTRSSRSQRPCASCAAAVPSSRASESPPTRPNSSTIRCCSSSSSVRRARSADAHTRRLPRRATFVT